MGSGVQPRDMAQLLFSTGGQRLEKGKGRASPATWEVKVKRGATMHHHLS